MSQKKNGSPSSKSTRIPAQRYNIRQGKYCQVAKNYNREYNILLAFCKPGNVTNPLICYILNPLISLNNLLDRSSDREPP